ncbi:MBL fold metallo-hydrolase [Candidatus Micrarchaeota archaeon]|nr:MBL fold metallo-hydrolase [Candidatus Micrarchaeota archaeon]MBU1165474.1 MBL fold metallo-hydrolase [Candidatus Micrarchaeota archaeon]MBU1886312.1 MBL fold metallo-hydrolase [Candidatus Micrarchaeota archaeon]
MQILCGDTTIGLDHPKADISFLSHAHADHTAGLKRKKQMMTSQETLDLAGLGAEIITLQNTRLLDAGHILGARQLAIENNGEKIVYTGDICLEPNIFGFKAEIPECDHLIIEATYGDPSYHFPPVVDVYNQIRGWVKQNYEKNNLIIGCYHLGKAQEVIKILNEESVVPVVTEKTDQFCSIYDKYGYKLERIVVGSDEAEEVMSRGFVSILPMNKAKRYFAHKLAQAFDRPTLCAAATGWSLHYQMNVDMGFPLSDHAGFDDLVRYVNESNAKKVEFFCGDGSAVLRAAKGFLNS